MMSGTGALLRKTKSVAQSLIFIGIRADP